MRGSTAAAPFPRCPGGRAAGTALWGEGRRRGALARALAAAPRRRRRRRQWRGLGACAGQGGRGRQGSVPPCSPRRDAHKKGAPRRGGGRPLCSCHHATHLPPYPPAHPPAQPPPSPASPPGSPSLAPRRPPPGSPPCDPSTPPSCLLPWPSPSWRWRVAPPHRMRSPRTMAPQRRRLRRPRGRRRHRVALAAPLASPSPSGQGSAPSAPAAAGASPARRLPTTGGTARLPSRLAPPPARAAPSSAAAPPSPGAAAATAAAPARLSARACGCPNFARCCPLRLLPSRLPAGPSRSRPVQRGGRGLGGGCCRADAATCRRRRHRRRSMTAARPLGGWVGQRPPLTAARPPLRRTRMALDESGNGGVGVGGMNQGALHSASGCPRQAAASLLLFVSLVWRST
eukprot:contig_30213_g7396